MCERGCRCVTKRKARLLLVSSGLLPTRRPTSTTAAARGAGGLMCFWDSCQLGRSVLRQGVRRKQHSLTSMALRKRVDEKDGNDDGRQTKHRYWVDGGGWLAGLSGRLVMDTEQRLPIMTSRRCFQNNVAIRVKWSTSKVVSTSVYSTEAD